MFGKGGRSGHAQLVRVELGETFDHLKQAAAHAATGVGETVGPRAAEGVQQMRKLKKTMRKQKEPPMSRKRWPRLAGLLIAGAAVGAAGALVMRRRQHRWQEYEPTQSIEPAHADFEPAASSAPATDVTSAESAAAKLES